MICSQCKKEFIKTHHSQKLCSEECRKINKKEWRKKNRQTDRSKEIRKKYLQLDKVKVRQKKYYQSDIGKEVKRRYNQSAKGRENNKKWEEKYKKSEKGKATHNKYKKRRMETDPKIKIIHSVRTRLNLFLRNNNIKKTNTTFKMVGCTPKFLKEYLEKKFKPGMSWQNHTKTGWHIDHIKPLNKAKSPEAVKKLMHYTNLQPLWATENLKKGNKY